MLFTPRIILNFVKYVERAIKEDSGKIGDKSLKTFPMLNHIKINR